MINVSDNRPRNIVLKYKMPLIKGENSIFSIDCLYANDRAPIPKRSCAYTRFETHFILTNKQFAKLMRNFTLRNLSQELHLSLYLNAHCPPISPTTTS